MKKLILAIVTMGLVLTVTPQHLGAVTVEISPEPEPPSIPAQLTVDEHLEKIFGADAKIAKATILHESGQRLDAMNWNCRYNGKSTSCKKEDRANAWSVDCGIGQINVKGKVCPPELFTLEGNMEAIERIYKTQGLNAWVSYKTGAYKKYL